MTCNECSGSGIIYCGKCNNGFTTHSRKINVNVVKGSLKEIILENTVIRIELKDKKYFVN